MRSKQDPSLLTKPITLVSTFFSDASRNRLREVSSEWKNAITPVQPLFILGSPVAIETRSEDGQFVLRKKLTEEEINDSFAAIPEDGFMIFRSYEDAFLYAHNHFNHPEVDPNYNKGIHGLGNPIATFFSDIVDKRDHFNPIKHHPVIFAVLFNKGSEINIEWHPYELNNLGGETRKVQISAIREEACKKNIEILTAKVQLGFIDNKAIPSIIFYDSNPQKPVVEPEKPMVVDNSWCSMM